MIGNAGGSSAAWKIDGMIPSGQVLEEKLLDPVFRAEWERLAPAREVANLLIAFRADHGLTQTDLGRLFGISLAAVEWLETGDHVPAIGTLVKAKSLGVLQSPSAEADEPDRY